MKTTRRDVQTVSPAAEMADIETRVPIAITGIAMHTALGSTTEDVWSSLCRGDIAVKPVQRFSGVHTAVLGDHPVPEAHESPGTSPTERLGLALARAALASAGLPKSSWSTMGVVIGSNTGPQDLYDRFLELAEDGSSSTLALQTIGDVVATGLGLHGPVAVFGSGCMASGDALGYALDLLREGVVSAMLVGGIELMGVRTLAVFNSWRSLDKQPTAPYTRSGGLSLGEGGAFLVLETAAAASARGAVVTGYIAGCGTSNDAYHVTAAPPTGEGLIQAMEAALDEAGLSQNDVQFISGHGTGTPTNDVAESKALETMFPERDQRPPMSTSKSQIGHTLGACGVLGAAFTVLAMRDSLLPPTANVDDTQEAGWDIVPKVARPAKVEIGMSNSLSFGGGNCSVVLTRTPTGTRRVKPRDVVITGVGSVLPEHADGTPTDSADSYLAYVDSRLLPRMDAVGRMSVAAARIAWENSKLSTCGTSRKRIGLALGSASGPMAMIGEVTELVLNAGAAEVEATRGPNIVAGVAAGYACMSLGLKGPFSAANSGTVSGLIALARAVEFVRSGRADAMIVVAADEVTDPLREAYRRLGLVTSETARPWDSKADGGALVPAGAAIVIESAEHAAARFAPVLGRVRSYSTTAGAAPYSPSFRRAEDWARCVRAAVGGERDVDVFGYAWGVPEIDTAEAAMIASVFSPGRARLSALAGATGHGQAAAPLLSLVRGLDASQTGIWPAIEPDAPLGILADHLTTAAPVGVRPFLVSAAGWGGSFGAALIDLEPSADR